MKIGKYHIPDLDPQKALDFASIVYEFPEHTVSRDGFAEKIGVKKKSGWFGQILAAFKKYNFAKIEGSRITTTDLTEKLLNPKPNTNELEEAKLSVFNSIELWKILYSKGYREKEVKKSDFWVDLSEIESIKALDRKTIIKKAPEVQKRYIQALSYIKDAITPEQPSSAITPSKAAGFGRREKFIQSETETPPSELLQIKYGDFYVETTKEDAKEILLVLAKKLGIDLKEKN